MRYYTMTECHFLSKMVIYAVLCVTSPFPPSDERATKCVFAFSMAAASVDFPWVRTTVNVGSVADLVSARCMVSVVWLTYHPGV